MSNQTFILSDETLNSNGFVVLTKGIDIERFKQNPIMLYMHDRETGIIGRWENIRIESNKLLADPVFDESDPLGVQIKKKVEGGFIRSASISITDIENKTIDGVETVVKCVLNEVSIVDIPSNQNAVKLCLSGGKYAYSLSDLNNNKPADLRSEIINLLGLKEDVRDNAILSAIKNLLNADKIADSELSNALRLGLVTKSQGDMLRTMEMFDKQKVNLYITDLKKEYAKSVAKVVDKAVTESKILYYERDIYEKIGNESGIATLRKLINVLPNPIKPMDIIERGSKESWNLMDYRKFAPNELQDNPELYKRLLSKDNKQSGERSLDWYRKNDPDYLMSHPDIYEKLLNKEHNINN